MVLSKKQIKTVIKNMSQICAIFFQLGHNFKQLQLVSSKMPQMFDTLLKPRTYFARKRADMLHMVGREGGGELELWKAIAQPTYSTLLIPTPLRGPHSPPLSNPFIVIVLFNF